jgi:hypothetical protein
MRNLAITLISAISKRAEEQAVGKSPAPAAGYVHHVSLLSQRPASWMVTRGDTHRGKYGVYIPRCLDHELERLRTSRLVIAAW